MNYNKLEDVVTDYMADAYSMGINTSGAFDEAVDMVIEAIDDKYGEQDFLELLRIIRIDIFGNARGEAKSLLDNMLYELLDVVSFG
ncbi:MAG: hypothetical protein Unbinned1446contig1005_11 [Prokaryotic dsDNA virus sp.]|mgnify:CR=1 FL=1|nr:MAG: hypothetical protein Unbinned1446contig1005_11 [Prokaryotic dsDNA virus sp.]|tara:strand:+ start:1566 stop:1823 length:258 start_codon:yes stop_codon:yes gene_type:complete